MTNSLLSPPEAFAIVEEGVYRSNIPHPSNYAFLKMLQLKTVLLLSPEVPSRSLAMFLDDIGVKLVHLGLSGWTPSMGWRPVAEELVKDGLEMLLNQTNHPILLMCASGTHETGIMVGCLRKLQHWNFNSIVSEYRRLAGSKSRYGNEQFIELFDTDLVALPSTLPFWLPQKSR